MLAALRARQPGAPISRVLWWHFLHLLCYVWVAPSYRYRAFGLRNVPRSGPVLFVSNHQSFLDPILVGLSAHHRQFYAMARSTLWRNKLLAKIIDSLNAIPVERGSADTTSVRRCIDVLKAGHALLIFPEGTRSFEGDVKPFASGTMLLIKRARPTVVPVAIEGAQRAWPKGRKLPLATGRIRVCFGEPIEADSLITMKADAALEHLRATIETMRRGLELQMDSDAHG